MKEEFKETGDILFPIGTLESGMLPPFLYKGDKICIPVKNGPPIVVGALGDSVEEGNIFAYYGKVENKEKIDDVGTPNLNDLCLWKPNPSIVRDIIQRLENCSYSSIILESEPLCLEYSPKKLIYALRKGNRIGQELYDLNLRDRLNHL